ncbi:PREDICTED: uncharacterized protein LOC109227451 [Nicotiana attenuata]|uniref:Uncharacterized protein n=1 Tax=Nicotiana attenuata TaxID=49451 RepID=A0A1J6ICQ4_NICAT|nr:PREDICTED: uncharacterized protein LOC109227451 [Nicotiana attenuata]OIT02829.1 hypothetical protein A4A49_39332 [Nicotiana attenuata]
MVSEMGNTNSSEAENAAVDAQQKGEAAGNANGVKEEDNIISEGESKDYHEKAAALPIYDLENSEDGKTGFQTDANDLVSEVTNIETHNFDQPLESVLEGKDDPRDQPCNQKGEAEGSLPHDEVLKTDPGESSSVANETVEECIISSSFEEQETTRNGRSGQNEDKTQLINSEIALADKGVVSDQRDDSLVSEMAASADGSNEEKHELMSAENQVENGFSNGSDWDEIPKVESNQIDATVSLLTDIPLSTPSSSLSAAIEPEDKCAVHTPESELISNESDNAVKECDLKKTESCMQAVHEMQIDNVASSIESHPKEATEENLPGNDASTDIVMDYSIKGDDINVQPDILHYDHTPPVEMGLHPTKFFGTENGLLDKAKGGVEKSSRKEIMEKCILQLGSSKLENDVDIAYAEGRMRGFESVEDKKECNAALTGQNSCEFVITEDSGVFELKTSEKGIKKIAAFPESGIAQNVQPSLEALAFSNEKCAYDQMVPNFHDETLSKAPEGIGSLSLESIPDKLNNGIELRKSPSFDFVVPSHRRSLESDQTPLLCPEMIPTRSSSVGSNVKFSNSLDYGSVAVEEKTIRMERSDSEAPLLGLLKNGDPKFTSETQQNHVAVMKGEELQTSQATETCLTSPKGSGKRKARPSFFSTCICCTAATHY